MLKSETLCPDCGNKKGLRSLRCNNCARHYRSGINHPNWKGGKPKCLDCWKIIKYGSKRCRKCSNIEVGHRKEVKEKQRLAKLGCRNPIFGRYGKLHPNYGMKFSEETIRLLSIQRKGKSYWKDHKMPIEMRRKMSESQKGQKCYNWQGGKTEFHEALRSLFEYREWRNAIFQRDNYICNMCKIRGGKLQAHHKKQMALLVIEFLKEYNQFSLLEDREILIRLAQNYKPFWDLDNGITICKNCHNKLKKERYNEYTQKTSY